MMVRNYIEHLIGDQAETFAKWAFGPDFKKIYSSEMPEAWNKLHEDKLKLFMGGRIKEDIPKMIEIWKLTL